MATLEALQAVPGEIVISAVAVVNKPPHYRHGRPVNNGSIHYTSLTEKDARLRVTALRVGHQQHSEVSYMTVLDSVDRDRRPGALTIINKGFSGFIFAPHDNGTTVLPEAGIRIRTHEGSGGQTRVEVFPNSKIDHGDRGRRIYIHDNSFTELALKSEQNARYIYDALMRVQALKRAYGEIGDAVDFNLLSNEEGDSIKDSLEKRIKGQLSEFLQQIGFQSPDNSRDFFPILEQDEQIVGSCWEGGYNTFATGKEASDIMFLEQGSLREQRASMRQGTGDLDTNRDLTMTKGRLAFIDPMKGTGLDVAKLYFSRELSQEQRVEPLNNSQPEVIKGEIRETVLDDIAQVIFTSKRWNINNPDHLLILNNLFASCVVTLTNGVFKDSGAGDPAKRLNSAAVAQQLIDKYKDMMVNSEGR